MNGKSHFALLDADPKKGIIRLAIPMVAAFFFQTCFNLVDTFFVGKLGADAIAAVGLAFPVQMFIIAIASGLGIGAQSYIARSYGANDTKTASRVAEHTVILALVVGIITSVVGLLTIETVIGVLGAPEAAYRFSIDYLSVILGGSIFIYMNMMLDSILRGEGDTKRPMIFMGTGALLNIVLDPIFIFTLGMGVRGAAIATILSRICITAAIVYFLLISSRAQTKLNMRKFRFSWPIVRRIIDVGIPASLSQVAISVVMFLMNNVLSLFGSPALATFGVGIRVESLIFMPMIGLSSAFVSAVGYFRGSGRIDQVKGIYWFCVRSLLVLMVVCGIFFYAVPDWIFRIFTDDAAVIANGVEYLRIFVFGYPLLPMSIIASAGFQGMGRGMPPLILVIIRSGMVSLPLAYICTFILGYGLWTVWAAITLGDILSGTIGHMWLFHYLNAELRRASPPIPKAF